MDLLLVGRAVFVAVACVLTLGLWWYRRRVGQLEARIRATRIELSEAMLREGTPTGSNCVLRAYAALDSDRSADIVNKAFPESTR